MSSTLCQGFAKQIGTFHSPVRPPPSSSSPRLARHTPSSQKPHPRLCVSHPPPSVSTTHPKKKPVRPHDVKNDGWREIDCLPRFCFLLVGESSKSRSRSPAVVSGNDSWVTRKEKVQKKKSWDVVMKKVGCVCSDDVRVVCILWFPFPFPFPVPFLCLPINASRPSHSQGIPPLHTQTQITARLLQGEG